MIKNTFWKMADVIKFPFSTLHTFTPFLCIRLIWTTFMLFFTILLFYTTDCTFQKCLLRIVESLKVLNCLNKLPRANLIFSWICAITYYIYLTLKIRFWTSYQMYSFKFLFFRISKKNPLRFQPSFSYFNRWLTFMWENGNKYR